MALSSAVQLKYRPMLESDLDAVMQIEVQAYPFPWTRGNFIDSLHAGYSAWVVEQGAELMGYAVFMKAIDETHLLNITIAPAYQGQGYGQWLLEQCIEQAQYHGALRMLLEVRPSNLKAQQLYERRGFKILGRRRGYYPSYDNTREDACVMVLNWQEK
jgi:ribosomal-protein-alanine N-acetyltransferase